MILLYKLHNKNKICSEYNPDELVNSDLKRSVAKKKLPYSDKELEHKIRSHLKGLQLDSKKIKSFFNAPYTSYAA